MGKKSVEAFSVLKKIIDVNVLGLGEAENYQSITLGSPTTIHVLHGLKAGQSAEEEPTFTGTLNVKAVTLGHHQSVAKTSTFRGRTSKGAISFM